MIILFLHEINSILHNEDMTYDVDFKIRLVQGPFQKLKVIFVQNGRELSHASETIPFDMRFLIKESLSYDSIETTLISFLSGKTMPYVFEICVQDQWVDFQWDPNFVLNKRTYLQARYPDIIAQRVGVSARSVYFHLLGLGAFLVADVESRRLGLWHSGDNDTWPVWQALGLQNKEAHQKIAQPGVRVVFQEIGGAAIYSFDDCRPLFQTRLFGDLGDQTWGFGNEHILLDKKPQTKVCQYAVKMIKETNFSTVTIQKCCRAEAHSVPFDLELFEALRFFESVPPVWFVRHRMVFYRMLYHLLTEPVADADAYMNTVLESIEPDASACDALKMYVQFILSEVAGSGSRLQLTEAGWFLAVINLKLELIIHLLLWLTFEASHDVVTRQVGQDSAEMYHVDWTVLLRYISALKTGFDARGIEFTFQDKPIQLMKLDMALTVQDHGDWFALHPQVNFQGQGVPIDQWRHLYEEGVMIAHDGVMLLETASRYILEAVFRLMPAPDKPKRSKKKLWIEISRLHIFDWLHLRAYGILMEIPKSIQKLLDRLMHFDHIQRHPLPAGFVGTLREYQLEGMSWLLFLYENRFGACLADDMGLGKTVQAIAFLATLRQQHSKARSIHLIVVPPTILHHWYMELQRFFPEFKVFIFSGAARRSDFKGFDVVLTTYELVRRDIVLLKEIAFDVIVFDEAQAVKNIYAERTAAVRQLQGRFRLCLTGTPMENHLGEYFSIMDLAVPGLLGDYRLASRHLKSTTLKGLDGQQGSSEYSEMVSRFMVRTRPFVLRRQKSKILSELPPKLETDIYLTLSEPQRVLYTAIAKEASQAVSHAFNEKPAGRARILALTALLRLRQVCICPQLVDPSFPETSPKLDYLIEKLQEVLDEGHSVLVFSQFRMYLDAVAIGLGRAAIPYFQMDGKTPILQRKKLVQNFQESPSPRVFLISLKTGGVGLNLTRASYVFLLDPWWNPAVEDQAADRAHRIGQQAQVFVVRLLMLHTVEEKMMQLKSAKRQLFDQIVNKKADQYQGLALTKSDFEFLLKP